VKQVALTQLTNQWLSLITPEGVTLTFKLLMRNLDDLGKDIFANRNEVPDSAEVFAVKLFIN